MPHLGPFDVAIAIFVFITVSAVAGIVADYKKRRLAVEALRAAIERGQPLDTALVERLIAPEERKKALNPLWLKIGGIVTIAASVGVAVFAVVLALTAPQALYPLLGIGGAALCVGIGLLVAAGVVQAHQGRAEPHGS